MGKQITVEGDLKIRSRRDAASPEIALSGARAEGNITPSPKIYAGNVTLPYIIADVDGLGWPEETGAEGLGRVRITIEFLGGETPQ